MPQYGDNHTLTGDILTSLANGRRRIIIRVLADRQTISKRELSEIITKTETNCPVVDATNRKSVYTSLYQTHLPNLQETEIVSVTDSTVNQGEQFSLAVEVLNCVDSL